MLRATVASVFLVSALGALATDYGNVFYIGPFNNKQYITKATYSMTAPSIPFDYDSSDSSLWVSLWVGLQESSTDVYNENFVQPLLNWALSNEGAGCSADQEHWCAAASTYTPSGQMQQAYVPIPSNATLDFEGKSPQVATALFLRHAGFSADRYHTVALDTDGYVVQKIWMNGDLISNQTDSKGMQPNVIYSANECSDANCGTLPAYSWTNLTLSLSAAVDNIEQYLTLKVANTSGFTTPDGGLTWHVDEINMGTDSSWRDAADIWN